MLNDSLAFLFRRVVPTGLSNPVIATVALSGASQSLLIPGSRMKRVIVINQSVANQVTLQFGAAAVAGQGLVLGCRGAGAQAGLHIWDSGAGPCPIDQIFVIGTAGQAVTAIAWDFSL